MPVDPREFARVLRSGSVGREHSPLAAADLLDALARERDELQARVDELEAVVFSTKTRGYARDAYARGWRACQAALAERVPPGSVAEQEILSAQPDFGMAGRAAREAA